MRQKWRGPDGKWVEVGDRDDVADILFKPRAWGLTFAGWARKGLPKTNPAPKPVAIDRKTRRDLWILAECRAWEFRREGPGHRVRL